MFVGWSWHSFWLKWTTGACFRKQFQHKSLSSHGNRLHETNLFASRLVPHNLSFCYFWSCRLPGEEDQPQLDGWWNPDENFCESYSFICTLNGLTVFSAFTSILARKCSQFGENYFYCISFSLNLFLFLLGFFFCLLVSMVTIGLS